MNLRSRPALAALLASLALSAAASAGLVRDFSEAARALPSVPAPARAIAFSPDGKLLAAAGADGKIQLWLADDGSPWRTLELPGGATTPATALLFSGDGARLFSAHGSRLVEWDVAVGEARRRFEGHAAEVTALARIPGGGRWASAGADGRLQLWDAQSGSAEARLQGEAPIDSAAATPDGKLLVTGAPADETLRDLNLELWDLAKGKRQRRLVGHSGEVFSVSAGGKWIAAATEAGAHLWNVSSELWWQLPGTVGARVVAFRPDGELLLVAGGGTLAAWDPAQRVKRGTADGKQGQVLALAFGPDGKRAASAGSDGSIKLWDLRGFAGRLPDSEEQQAVDKARAVFDTWDNAKGDAQLAQVTAVAERFPKSADAWLAVAVASLKADKGVVPANAALAKALAADPGHVQSLVLQGLIQMKTDQLDAAKVTLLKAVQLNPNSTEALAYLTNLGSLKKDPDSAQQYALRSAQLMPGDPGALYNVACGLSLRGRTAEALDWLERSFQAGYENYDGLKGDTDLDHLRGLPRYAELVTRYSGGSASASVSGTSERADQLRAQADERRKADDYAAAIPLYQKAIAEERGTKEPRGSKIRKDQLWLGFCAFQAEQLELARTTLENAVRLTQRVGSADDDVGAMSKLILGRVYRKLALFEKAIAIYQENLRPLRARGDRDTLARGLTELSKVYAEGGRYDKALDGFREAQGLLEALIKDKADEKELPDRLLALYDEQADVYTAWGQPEKALELQQKRLQLAQQWSVPKQLLDAQLSIGASLLALDRFDAAIAAYQKTIELAKAQGAARSVNTAQLGIANACSRSGRLDQALQAAQEALARARQSGLGLHLALIATAKIRQRRGENDAAMLLLYEDLAAQRKSGDEQETARALSFLSDALPDDRAGESVTLLEEALGIYQKRGDLPMVAATRKDLGVQTYRIERWKDSRSHLEQAVAIYEQLRKTAAGDARRDYLAKVINVYELLILAQLRDQDTPAAFRTVELSKSKLLAERIAGADEVQPPPIAELPRIAGKGSILMISNVGFDQPVFFAVNSSGMQGWPKAPPPALKAWLDQPPRALLVAEAERARGFKAKGMAPPPPASGGRNVLERAVNTYRELLLNPAASAAGPRKELARLLYDALVAPNLKYLREGQELLIVPDGVLAFLPFETLIDPQGRYLAQTYDVHYVQSLSVLDSIAGRLYPDSRKPLLAFGGAVYDQQTYAKDMVQANEKQLFALAGRVQDALATRGSVRDAYAALGVKWENLPGTLAEVTELSRIVPGAEVITGDQVTEARVKQMSESGALAGYRVLHFATHGMVVPQIPELSALVLSQFATEHDGNDGYLHMQEIAGLHLQADFVNLSACETGLGKIFGGEGVVGLTQAFLIAGANGLSVSLWQVPDESTSRFMQEVYRLHQAKGTPWAQAIAEVKRKFISGGFGAGWTEPHYWAPFVYYGR